MINIMGAGGVRSRLVSVTMADELGVEVEIEFILLDVACAKAIHMKVEVLRNVAEYDIVNNKVAE